MVQLDSIKFAMPLEMVLVCSECAPVFTLTKWFFTSSYLLADM